MHFISSIVRIVERVCTLPDGRALLVAGALAAAPFAIIPNLAHAQAAPAAQVKPPFPELQLPARMRGEQAIAAVGARLPEVAAWYRMTPEGFAKLLREDRTAWLDQTGRLHYVDDVLPPESVENAGTASGASTTAAAPYPVEQTFALHSQPGAQRTVYLDFNGYLATNTAWNTAYGLSVIDAKPFDLDGDPTSFSATELERIQLIWQRVAEDYAPFDVDVTTEEPLADAITRSGSGDTVFGTRVVISRDWTTLSSSPCNCGGIGYVGIFDYVGDGYKPAWVFFDRLGSGNEKYVAEAISHEAGHNLGLSHDGYNNGTTVKGYYDGHGTGATGWAPIMGVGYYKELTQWSKGEYPFATQTQDDLAIIQLTGAPARLDDHGNSAGSATALVVSSGSGTLTLFGEGLIGTRSDVDFFSFYSGPGSINLNVAPAPRSPNLDINAELYDSLGQFVASSNPVDALNAAITVANAPAGTYYLKIDGVGKGDLATGYSDYASLGAYTITGTVPAATGLPPVASANATPTTGFAPLPVNFSSAGSYDPDGGALTYLWNFGDGSAPSQATDPSYTYSTPGTYVVTLTVTDPAGASDATQLTINVQDAVVNTTHVESIVMALSVKRGGTRASAKVTIFDDQGRKVSGATVTGTWSGVVSGNVSGTTGKTGVVTLSSPQTKSATGTFTFTVTSVSVAGYTYDASLNKESSDSISN